MAYKQHYVTNEFGFIKESQYWLFEKYLPSFDLGEVYSKAEINSLVNVLTRRHEKEKVERYIQMAKDVGLKLGAIIELNGKITVVLNINELQASMNLFGIKGSFSIYPDNYKVIKEQEFSCPENYVMLFRSDLKKLSISFERYKDDIIVKESVLVNGFNYYFVKQELYLQKIQELKEKQKKRKALF